MEFTPRKKKIFYVSVWVVILGSFLFMVAKAWGEAKTLNLRNATDSLMPLIELRKESGGHYDKAKADHVDMLNRYVRNMESRELSFLLKLPPFSNKNVAKELEHVAKVLQEDENSCEAIAKAAESIAKFLDRSKLCEGKPVISFKTEVISEELKNAIKDSLRESQEKVEIYANDPNVDNSEDACWANRKVIVYLYLARFGYQQVVSQEELRTFRTDMNRCIYYNRLLQRTDAVKVGKGVKGSDHWRLGKYSDSEVRRLQLLQAIMDDDIQQAQILLLIAVIEAFPHTQFLAATH